MSDDTTNPPPPPPRPGRPIPESYTIPRPAIEQWSRIPEQSYVAPRLTRKDFDKVFAAYDAMLRSQYEFQEAMSAYTNGDLAQANEKFQEARVLLYESQNAFRAVLTSILISGAMNHQ